MSKKILSLALAVVMLVSVFTIAASATNFPAEGQIGYRLTSDAYVGMPAGETVTVKCYYVVPDDLDLDVYRQGAGNVVICYNADYFTPDTDSRVFGDIYVDVAKETSGVTSNDALWKTVSGKFTEEDSAKGYSYAVQVALAWNTTGGFSASTGYPIDPNVEFFTLEFTTEQTLTEEAVMGVARGYIGTTMKPTYRDTVAKKTMVYAAENVITDECDITPDYLNINDNTAILLRNNAADANTVDVGFIATFMDASFEVAFADNGTTCTNLDNIGIDVRINGTVQSGVENADLNMIYPIDGGYQFVGAVTGIDADNLDTKIEARAYMIDSDGTTYYSNWIGCNANLRYDDAVDAGMNAIA